MKAWFTTLLLLIALPLQAQESNTVPLEHFFKHAEYRSIQLSPDGKYFAVVMPKDNQELLVVLDRSTMKPSAVQHMGENKIVGSFRWVTRDRLVVAPALSAGERDTRPQATGDLFAMNADGSKKMHLLGPGMSGENFAFAFDIQRVFPDDRDRIIITKIDSSSSFLTSYWLNVYTANVTRIGRSPIPRGQLAFDNEGNPRMAFGSNEAGESIVMYRETVDADWREISRGKMEDAKLDPIAFTADGKKLIASADIDRKTKALYLYDPATNQRQLLLGHDRVDVDDIIYDRSRQDVIGAWVEPDYRQTLFIDENHRDTQLYRGLQKAFRGANVNISSFTRDGKLATVIVTSDKEPAAFYLLDTETNRLTPQLRAMPWIDPKQMNDREAVKIVARDGLEMYGYLTLPKGKDKNLPLIMLVHGGPHGIRDSWQFDPEAQFFSSRGYAVLQLNFRGSGGYGREFMLAGYQKWHTAMQDDLTDGVRWAIREGIADPQRVCIYGASYGGYAALMSPTREPDLYKCAVGYVGVYDMELMFKKGDVPQRRSGLEYLERALGTDPVQLRAMSPVHQLDKLKAALFIVHGEKDIRAHFSHFEVLREALDKRAYPYEWMTKADEAHGFYGEQNRFDLYNKMIRFFDAHIGDKK